MGLFTNIHLSWRTLHVLLMGQVVSFFLALISFSSSLLANSGIYVPISQSILGYLALALVFGCVLLYRRKPLQIRWYWYLLLAFADVQGRYFANKAFQYTTITSVTLLDCFTIAWAMALTWLFLRTRYSLCQLFGVALCIAGLLLILLSDSRVHASGGPRPLLGDAFVIVGTLFLAISTVGEEFCVKKIDRVEVLAMIGLCGLIVSAIESLVLERNTLASIQWSTDSILVLLGYTLASFVFYALSPTVLERSGSTMFNLSLLTSNIWAVLIQTFFYHHPVKLLYYLAFVVVVVGIIIYSTNEEVVEDKDSAEYETLDDENETRALYHSVFWKSSLVS